ncbi:Type VI secretion system secreted protein VgrG [Beijerinckiaceae bacterium RH AL1]|nr:type VI secretion system tip protein TssI/VgrG [Beijerinckiaceae bacterium]VVB43011.1 Type VI secretion system secreted protein VgrG [Beijerinckiaceae bacterium RH AL8]VVB43024.1 Type VI secretion system secreted protein VgrG [Beijerinckiaceae bacterium RH CH11]VVC53622.1 Type VI secretion system secreted protein VgrG [Beijerinckiaceae bacterium RH AL1]
MNVHVPYTQSGRMMAISTPLGQDVLLLDHLAVDEGINDLFAIRASVKSQRDDLKAADLVGLSVDMSLKLKDAGTRYWNGLVTQLHEGSLTARGTRSYALTIRPKLWLLTRRSDCRIWLGTDATQVIETLCKEHGVTDFDLRITGAPLPLDYSVQWNETDFDYMLRRMQQVGLFYWFEHQQGRHTFVVSDHVSGYRDAPEQQVRFAEGSAAEDHISSWRRTFAFTPGKRSGRDWNWETMQAPEGDQTAFDLVPGSATEELYEFPGLFKDTTGAEQAMKYRIQATETGYETSEAASTVRTLAPGQKFTPFDKAKPSDVFAQQVLTSIRHVAVDPTYETAGGRPSYDNTFAAMPATTPATPHRTVPRPTIVGSQVALIAGPSGEEIYTEQYGRVKVWFPWDRRAKKDGSDTIWIRVGQPWAGTSWGYQVIPRIGMECLVSYQEGDPDRPFVTALVPDPTNPVPYALPDNKTRMVVRSKSYKSSGNNEMTFEDATGAENQFFNASKDQTTNVVNNATTSIAANQSNAIGQNQSTTVGQNATTEVGGSMNLSVGGIGAGAAAMMAPLMGMAGMTSGMLGQAMNVAGAGLGGGAGGLGASGIAGAAGAPASAAGAAFGGIGGLVSSATSMLPAIAGSAVGILGAAGQQAQSGVTSPSNPLADAGAALAGSGASLGSAVGSLFGLPGMLNVSVATMRTDSIGIAHAYQVGLSQAVNIGQTATENVGKSKLVTVGEELIIRVGQSSLTMRSDGTVIILGTNFNFTASGPVQINGEVVDLNKPGS